jgi:hypothetical protein
MLYVNKHCGVCELIHELTIVVYNLQLSIVFIYDH